jgi:flagellar biosynthesis protein FlhF
MMELHAELRDMRKLLNSQLSGMAWGQFNNQQPHKAAVWRRLSRLGLQGQQVRAVCDLLDDLPDEATAWRHALAHLTHRVPVCRNDLIDGGGVFAFVGPTGVGKTTTIGKLAARYVLQHGPENVALITTDCFRIAGHEQLRVFGRILGVTVKVLSDPSELADTVRMLRRKSLILIDTAGLRQGIPGHDEQIAALQSLGDKVQNLLVLPATAQLSVLKASHYAYQAIGLSGCVITKLDECASLGEALSLVMEMQLPVTYVTDGQQVPGDISTARAPQLVSRAVSLARHASVDEDQLADTYSEQWSDRQREALAY